MWQAPSVHYERSPDDVVTSKPDIARPYLDIDGRIKWWSGTDDLPVGTTPLYITIRESDGRRIFSTTNESERAALVFASRVILR